jgi:Zn-dependent protease with chaperone function
MELPSIGWFLLPVIAWVASGIAVVVVLRRTGTSRLLLRLSTLFLGLWTVLATTALVWLVGNGGWPALVSLAQRPPPIFASSSLWLWVLGGVGALAVLSAAFLVNQLVARSILKICQPQPLAWPPRFAARAGAVELRIFVSASAEAFSFTLMERSAGRWRRREIILLSDALWRTLEPAEREAVIAHEFAHVLDLDSRYLTFLRTFAKLMRWDPVLGYLARRLTHREEFLADDEAVASTQHPLALARALFKAITLPEGGSRSAAVGFLGVGGRRGRREAVERIRRLVALADRPPGPGADRA